MISVLSFGLVWLVVTMYMFLNGPWQEFGDEHPYITGFIILFGGLIVGNLLAE